MIGPSTGAVAAPARARSLWAALATGAGVGLLGGLIGLGGAEFRLPLLIGLFGFAALQAVIMNKALSLIVVVTALPARLVAVPFDTVSGYWFVVVTLLAGSLIGAWVGATWATRMRSATLYRVLAVLLVLIAMALAWNHFGELNRVFLDPVPRTLDLPDDIGAARRGDAAAAWAIPFPALPISLPAATTSPPAGPGTWNMIENSGRRMNICIDPGPALSS